MSTQFRTYKYRLMPTTAQCSLLAQFFGAKRWIYNHFLSEQKSRLEKKEKLLSNFDCNKEITQLKKQPETEWLRGIDDWCLKHASEDLATGFNNFFDSLKGKRKGPKVKIPRYKSRTNQQSYRTRGIKIDSSGNAFIPKIKWVKCIIDRTFVGEIKSATISKNPAGEYYISVLVEEDMSLLPQTGHEVGCDLGLKDILILSNGVKFAHPENILAKAKRELKKQQKHLSRKHKGSKNYEKQRIKVAKCYQKVTRIRNDYYHNISKYLVENFDAIYLENLNVKGLLKNRRLARKIQESAWSTLKSFIEYKSGYAGKSVHLIDRFFPSSKTCSCCGHKNVNLKLSEREWTCQSCSTHHDRDLNAAINIRQEGQKDLYDKILTSVETTEGGLNIPMSLQKHISKIERSVPNGSVDMGSKKTELLLAVQ